MADLKARIAAMTTEVSAEVVRRLEAGEPPASLGLEAADLIAALAFAGLGGEGSEGPSLVQVSPKYPSLGRVLNESSLAELFPGSARPARLALAAGLLQILDFWDASHTAAQEADDLGEKSTAAYWHMIAHRREPDAGNALYWARQVGRHPIFGPLTTAARPLLEAQGDHSLTPGSPWSPRP